MKHSYCRFWYVSIKFSTFSLIQIILKIILIYFSLKFNIDNYIYIFPNIETQIAKNMPAMQETQVLYLGWEDHLEEKIATNSCFLAWRISGTVEPGELQFMGLQRVGHN